MQPRPKVVSSESVKRIAGVLVADEDAPLRRGGVQYRRSLVRGRRVVQKKHKVPR